MPEITRAQRLQATQRAYEDWSEKTDFTSDFSASDQDESDLVALQMQADPQLNQGVNK